MPKSSEKRGYGNILKVSVILVLCASRCFKRSSDHFLTEQNDSGVLFTLIAKRFSANKRGLVKTFVISSLVFVLAHLLSLLQGVGIGATLLQVGYALLTGGLFAFVLIKTKNLLCCAFVHAIYNFCGLILDTPQNLGLGTGIVFDEPTIVLTAIVGVGAGLFVLYSLWKYDETERNELYKRLNVA